MPLSWNEIKSRAVAFSKKWIFVTNHNPFPQKPSADSLPKVIDGL